MAPSPPTPTMLTANVPAVGMPVVFSEPTSAPVAGLRMRTLFPPARLTRYRWLVTLLYASPRSVLLVVRNEYPLNPGGSQPGEPTVSPKVVNGANVTVWAGPADAANNTAATAAAAKRESLMAMVPLLRALCARDVAIRMSAGAR